MSIVATILAPIAAVLGVALINLAPKLAEAQPLEKELSALLATHPKIKIGRAHV